MSVSTEKLLSVRSLRSHISSGALAVSLAFLPVPGYAQSAPSPESEPVDAPGEQPVDAADEQASDGDETYDIIVVTGSRPRGAVITPYAPILELSEEDIASYGVSSTAELLDAIAPQTGGGRGRGSGRPVVLLNGQPVSSFRELRNIPPEAIRGVEVLPEEVALQYGYKPDKRVVNIMLKENFSSIIGELGQGFSTSGGYGTSEFEITYTKFTENSRLNLNVEYEPTTMLRESERDIIQSDELAPGETLVGALGPQDAGAFRTLLPATDPVQVNANYSLSLSPGTQLSLNAAYEHNESRQLFGLNNASLLVPASNPFARIAGDETIRVFTDEPRPLTRNTVQDSLQGGLALNGNLSGWRYSLTGDIDRTLTTTRTDQRADFSGINDGLALTDPALAIDPFTTDLGALLPDVIRDEVRSETVTGNILGRVSGTVFTLPAGEVQTTLSGGYSYISLDSTDSRLIIQADRRSRSVTNIAGNIEIPIFDADYGLGNTIGSLSLNANAGYRDVSGFGGLTEYGTGLTWKPADGLSIQASSINSEAAPSLSQLADPVIVTPNVSVFDLSRGETVLATVTTGGNPFLVAERQRDWKFAVNYRPPSIEGLSFQAEYFRNRSYDNSASFPVLTPEIEAAFPDRIIRDPSGRLLAVDRRPVTYDRVSSDKFRWGANFSKSFGRDEQRGARGRGGRGPGAGAAGGNRPDRARPGAGQADAKADGQTQTSETAQSSTPGEGQPQSTDANSGQSAQASNAPPASSRGRGRGRGGRPFGRPGGGRWNIYAFHTVTLEDSILIRPGVEELDLLDGSAIGSSGGSPRHGIEFGGGWFKDGLGFRVDGSYRSATRVDGSGLPGSSDLFFGDIATVNVRAFFNLGSREKLVEDIPFLKGSRVSLRVDNVFGGIQDVRDADGNVPLSYQPGFVDPRGRFIAIDFRKSF